MGAENFNDNSWYNDRSDKKKYLTTLDHLDLCCVLDMHQNGKVMMENT